MKKYDSANKHAINSCTDNKKFPFGMIWKSVDGFIADAELQDKSMGTRSQRSSRDGDNEWAGGSFDDVIELSKNGWPEGTENAREVHEKITKLLYFDDVSIFQREDNVCGSEPDIARYLSGTPECMVNYSLQPKNKRTSNIVRIFVNVSGNAGIAGQAFINRAAAVMAMCWEIHMQGESPEVWFGQLINGSGDEDAYFVQATCVMGAGEAFDEESFAFFTGHPAVLRRMIFSTQENMNSAARKSLGVGQGYGYCSGCGQEEHEAALKEHVEDISGPFDIVIPSLDTMRVNFSDTKESAEWVVTNLKSVGFQVTKQT